MPNRSSLSSNTGSGFKLYGGLDYSNNLNKILATNSSTYGLSFPGNIEDDLNN